MGNQKQKWTAEEEEALLAGIARHGPGKWKNILKDPDFAPSLSNRSNIDLKDKWRNLSVSTSGHSSKDRLRLAKVKSITATPYPATPKSAHTIAQACDAPSDTSVDDPSNSLQDGKNASQYNTLIFEALSTTKDAHGCDINAIFSYIEQRLEVPQNFRRQLSARLRRLAAQGKLEKDQNYYKISQDKRGAKAPVVKLEDNHLGQLPHVGVTTCKVTLDEAATTAAYNVAEAENKSYSAAEAVKEAERVSKMAEETDAMLQLVKGIYQQCLRDGQFSVA